MSLLVGFAVYCAAGMELLARQYGNARIIEERDYLHQELLLSAPALREWPQERTRRIVNVALTAAILIFVVLWLPILAWCLLKSLRK